MTNRRHLSLLCRKKVSLVFVNAINVSVLSYSLSTCCQQTPSSLKLFITRFQWRNNYYNEFNVFRFFYWVITGTWLCAKLLLCYAIVNIYFCHVKTCVFTLIRYFLFERHNFSLVSVIHDLSVVCDKLVCTVRRFCGHSRFV